MNIKRLEEYIYFDYVIIRDIMWIVAKPFSVNKAIENIKNVTLVCSLAIICVIYTLQIIN